MASEDDAKLRTQIAAQYRAVAHLAAALAAVHGQLAPPIEQGSMDALFSIIGPRSAHIMETLGDILNGMDATDEGEDAWTFPIFEEAHRLFPAAEQAA